MQSMPAAPAAASERFPLGIASFDPLQDGVLLWTALDGDRSCRWEVARDEAFTDVIASGGAIAEPTTGVVIVDVTRLPVGTQLWYRFASGGELSPVGRTRTLPGDGAERLRIGVTCCARFGQSPFTVYRELARADVDVVVHLGDYIYEDTKGGCDGREPDPDHDCVTLDDYRRRHAQARRDPDLQALHARHPMVTVWDDHDLADNAWRGGAKSHDEEEQGPWADRMAAALQAHNEHLPKRLADPDDETSAWRSLDAGDLVRLVLTETRAHRDMQAGLEDQPAADDPTRTMLGAEQARWIAPVLADRGPHWTIMASGTVVSELVIPAPEALDQVLPEKYAIVDGCAANTDQWDGYVVDRRQVACALAERGGRSIVLSGDIHSSWAIDGPTTPSGVIAAVELVAPPAATTPIGRLLPPGVGARLGPAFTHELAGVRWVDADHHGFLTLDVRRDAVDAAWWWVEPGSDDAALLGRRWTVPAEPPSLLVDPEPAREDDGTAPPSPLSGHRLRRTKHFLKAALAVSVAGAIAVWILGRPRGSG
jgi:alkaline phosphatase D